MMKCGLFITALGLTFDANEAKNRPVSKVITLLHDMQKTLEKEAHEDQEIFDKIACWCTTNDKEKTQAIKDAEQLIDQLTNRIEELTGKAARLQTEIANLRAEVKDNEDALNKATKLREKQNSEFQAREKELIAAIDQLKRAVEVLSKHHGSLIQESTLINVASLLHHQMQLHEDLFDQTITPHQQEVLRAFVQAPAYQSYNSRSGEIFGILQHMEGEFRNNLSDAQKTETQQQAAFEKLKEAKLEEIAAATKLADKKDVELAETNEANAKAKETLEDTKESLSADETYLMTLKQKCKETDAEYEQRQKTRVEETQAVSKAIEVLSSDDARDTFSSTFNKFIQISASQQGAIKVLQNAADIRHNPRIAQLAVRAKLDAFTKVKKAIDQMISELSKEKEDEVKHKDWCDEELRTNDKLTRKNTRDTQDSNTEIDRLRANIKSLTERIATLNQEVADLHVDIKRAGEDRQAQNTEFQQTVEDQRDTQRLLTQALSVLKTFYAKEKPALVQQPAGPPPPEGFKEYKKNPQSGGVLNLIQQIIDDAKAMEEEAIRDEEASQVAYESMIRESNDSIQIKTKARVNAEADKAQAEIDLTEEKVNLEGLKAERTNLDSERAATHKSCDFVLENFEVRQDARDQEIQALKQAKAILSGAKFEKFLQRA